ncbi:MAG: nucleotide exchange factor GrpE [Bacteroidetes bacterium]|nr:nucleotide exchange factor GrpE [Bacteroidota bacterium]
MSTEKKTKAKSTDKNKLKQLKQQVEETNDKYIRLLAEFENFKRVTARERIELIQIADKDLMMAILPVMDDFDRAFKALESSNSFETAKEGMEVIYKKFKETLESKGLKEMVSIGEDFNSDLHEAISNVPAKDKKLKNKVFDEVEKGYYLNDTIIRHAKVVVNE